MNGYVCFYRGKRVEVYADTPYRAQVLAAARLGVKESKRHEVSVTLAEKDGREVVHSGAELP